MFKSKGKVIYGPEIRAILSVDKGLSSYYFSLIPKYYCCKWQLYPPHISFVRNETPKNMKFWKKYSREIVEFEYSPTIHRDETYFWINAYCERLCDIRLELGLPKFKYGTHFHITLGNVKKE